MEIFWFIVLMVMLGTYVILDGYDFGAGIVHLFFAKTKEEKKAVTNAIGPFWDANEVWLIAAGGVLFFAFPTLYASAFRSEERRVGKECRSRWLTYHCKINE